MTGSGDLGQPLVLTGRQRRVTWQATVGDWTVAQVVTGGGNLLFPWRQGVGEELLQVGQLIVHLEVGSGGGLINNRRQIGGVAPTSDRGPELRRVECGNMERRPQSRWRLEGPLRRRNLEGPLSRRHLEGPLGRFQRRR